jgi:hypothetical protein
MSEVLVSGIATECEKRENEFQEAEADVMGREESEEEAQIRRVGVAGEEDVYLGSNWCSDTAAVISSLSQMQTCSLITYLPHLVPIYQHIRWILVAAAPLMSQMSVKVGAGGHDGGTGEWVERRLTLKNAENNPDKKRGTIDLRFKWEMSKVYMKKQEATVLAHADLAGPRGGNPRSLKKEGGEHGNTNGNTSPEDAEGVETSDSKAEAAATPTAPAASPLTTLRRPKVIRTDPCVVFEVFVLNDPTGSLPEECLLYVSPTSIELCAMDSDIPCSMAWAQMPLQTSHAYDWEQAKVSGRPAPAPEDMDDLFMTITADGQIMTIRFECEEWSVITAACCMQHKIMV